MNAPGLIIAAPASGSGKTLVTAGLLRDLRGRGLRVAAAKSGPDFIDPGFLALAAGARCLNLDPWAMRAETLAALVGQLSAAADCVLCEGVMGLFDGTGADGEAGSTAELSRITGWPVVLVVDARGQGVSVAALLRGFVSHRSDIAIAGIVFNNLSSERHRALLTAAAARYLPDLPVFGALAADPALTLASRHLGLVPAAETAAADALIDRAAARIGASFDIPALLAAARPTALASAGTASAPVPPLGQRIAIARDEAFCFAYPSVLEGWRRAGAELSFFSPLCDQPPAADADAIYLPGGYPELSAARLAAADHFLSGLRDAASRQKPAYGECGGYMVLGETLMDAEGRTYPMSGLLPVATSFAERRLQLGYRQARLARGTALGPAGRRFRGHEFHYATVLREAAAAPLWLLKDADGTGLGPCGLARGSVFGSFIHLIDTGDRPS